MALIRSNSLSGSGNFNIEEFQLDATEVSNEAIVLSSTPVAPAEVMLFLPAGSTQRNGFDFEVVGNELRWNGFALETLLAENDILLVQYFSS